MDRNVHCWLSSHIARKSLFCGHFERTVPSLYRGDAGVTQQWLVGTRKTVERERERKSCHQADKWLKSVHARNHTVGAEHEALFTGGEGCYLPSALRGARVWGCGGRCANASKKKSKSKKNIDVKNEKVPVMCEERCGWQDSAITLLWWMWPWCDAATETSATKKLSDCDKQI